MTHPYILERIEQAETSAITFPKDVLIESKTRQAGNFIQSRLIKEADYYETKNKKISLFSFTETPTFYTLQAVKAIKPYMNSSEIKKSKRGRKPNSS